MVRKVTDSSIFDFILWCWWFIVTVPADAISVLNPVLASFAPYLYICCCMNCFCVNRFKLCPCENTSSKPLFFHSLKMYLPESQISSEFIFHLDEILCCLFKSGTEQLSVQPQLLFELLIPIEMVLLMSSLI